jgi:hypothetical protein
MEYLSTSELEEEGKVDHMEGKKETELVQQVEEKGK